MWDKKRYQAWIARRATYCAAVGWPYLEQGGVVAAAPPAGARVDSAWPSTEGEPYIPPSVEHREAAARYTYSRSHIECGDYPQPLYTNSRGHLAGRERVHAAVKEYLAHARRHDGDDFVTAGNEKHLRRSGLENFGFPNWWHTFAVDTARDPAYVAAAKADNSEGWAEARARGATYQSYALTPGIIFDGVMLEAAARWYVAERGAWPRTDYRTSVTSATGGLLNSRTTAMHEAKHWVGAMAHRLADPDYIRDVYERVDDDPYVILLATRLMADADRWLPLCDRKGEPVLWVQGYANRTRQLNLMDKAQSVLRRPHRILTYAIGKEVLAEAVAHAPLTAIQRWVDQACEAAGWRPPRLLPTLNREYWAAGGPFGAKDASGAARVLASLDFDKRRLGDRQWTERHFAAFDTVKFDNRPELDTLELIGKADVAIRESLTGRPGYRYTGDLRKYKLLRPVASGENGLELVSITGGFQTGADDTSKMGEHMRRVWTWTSFHDCGQLSGLLHGVDVGACCLRDDQMMWARDADLIGAILQRNAELNSPEARDPNPEILKTAFYPANEETCNREGDVGYGPYFSRIAKRAVEQEFGGGRHPDVWLLGRLGAAARLGQRDEVERASEIAAAEYAISVNATGLGRRLIELTAAVGVKGGLGTFLKVYGDEVKHVFDVYYGADSARAQYELFAPLGLADEAPPSMENSIRTFEPQYYAVSDPVHPLREYDPLGDLTQSRVEERFYRERLTKAP